MRTAKYHDFGALKAIVLLVALVILGLFVYNQYLKPAFFHTADEDAWVVEEPTCEADGRRYKICTDENCGKEFDIEVIPALGHDVQKNATVTKDATCTEEGSGYKACTRCDKVFETITYPALGHTEAKPVSENEKEHTSTQGASFEKVTYCSVCNDELSREKVDVPHETQTLIIPEVEPTCHTEGSGYLATFCVTCNKNIDVATEPVSIDTTPHTYAWSIIYIKGEFKISSGVCTVEECGHEYDPETDGGYTLNPVLNEEASIKPTCLSGLNVYDVYVLYLGKAAGQAVVSYEVPAIEEHYILTSDGSKVALSTLVNYDKSTGRPYYNYSTGLFALVLPERQEGQSYEEYIASAWDENGFGTGTFICTNEVGDEFHHVQVTIYNDKA